MRKVEDVVGTWFWLVQGKDDPDLFRLAKHLLLIAAEDSVDEGDDLYWNKAIDISLFKSRSSTPPQTVRRDPFILIEPALKDISTLDQSYYHMLPTLSRETKIRLYHVELRKRFEKWERNSSSSHSIEKLRTFWWLISFGYGLYQVGWTQMVWTSSYQASPPGKEWKSENRVRLKNDLQGSVLSHRCVPSPSNLHQTAPISNSIDLVSRILAVICRGLDRHQNLKTVEFLQMFQNTIGDAASWNMYAKKKQFIWN